MMLAAMGAMAAGVLTMTWGAVRPTPAEALTNCDTSTAALNSAEQQVVAEINAYRVANGRAPLKVSANLSRAAAWMAEDLLANNYWSHTDSWKRSAYTRVQQCGYVGTGAGENLAMGFSGASVVSAWKSSPDHNTNMLNSYWKVIGVGNAGGYWAADFGSYDDSGDTSDPGSGGGSGSGPATPTPFPPTSTPIPRFSTPVAAQPTATPTQFVPAPANSYAYPSFLPIRRVSVPMLAAE